MFCVAVVLTVVRMSALGQQVTQAIHDPSLGGASEGRSPQQCQGISAGPPSLLGATVPPAL